MVSATHSVCDRMSRLSQVRNAAVLMRAVQRSTLSSPRRNKQNMARGNVGVVSRKRVKQKIHRRKLVEGSRKPVMQIVRKLQTLRRLVPDGNSAGIDDLFCAAADYILTLQMKVRVMEYMVNMFTPKDPDN